LLDVAFRRTFIRGDPRIDDARIVWTTDNIESPIQFVTLAFDFVKSPRRPGSLCVFRKIHTDADSTDPRVVDARLSANGRRAFN